MTQRKNKRGRPRKYTDEMMNEMAKSTLMWEVWRADNPDLFLLRGDKSGHANRAFPTLTAARKTAAAQRMASERWETAPRNLFGRYRTKFGKRADTMVLAVQRGDPGAIEELKAALSFMRADAQRMTGTILERRRARERN